MGSEVLIPLAISALGAGAQWYGSDQALKSQDRAAAQGIQTQAANQRQADYAVNASVDKLGQSSPEASRVTATNDFLGQLRRNRSQATPGATPGGSSRYESDMAGAGKDVADFGTQEAGILGRVNAPAMQREQEGISFNRLHSDLNQIGRNSAGDQFLTQLRMRSAQPNPWLNAAGSVAQGAATGMAGRPGTTTPRTGTPIPRVDTPRGIPASPYAPRNV
jgi:hypothetical protein